MEQGQRSRKAQHSETKRLSYHIVRGMARSNSSWNRQ
jgi:hypothetical protein